MLSENKFYKIEPASKNYRNKLFSVVFIISALSLIYIYFSPIKFFFNNVLNIPSENGCPLLTFTRIPCPFCGSGRVFSAITDFKFLDTFYFNPLGLFFYFFTAIILFFIITLALINKKLVLKKPALKLWYIPVLFISLMWLLNILFGHHN